MTLYTQAILHFYSKVIFGATKLIFFLNDSSESSPQRYKALFLESNFLLIYSTTCMSFHSRARYKKKGAS